MSLQYEKIGLILCQIIPQKAETGPLYQAA